MPSPGFSNASFALWQVSVLTTADAEESVSGFIEHLLLQCPSVYADARTGRVAVSVYLRGLAVPGRQLRNQLRSGLKNIRNHGLDTTPGTITIRRIRRTDWAESWKKHFKPVEISRTLLIKPGWSKRCPREGQAVVVLDPGLSFGTGQHPTTSFCLKQLANKRCAGRSQSFLDIGTGSGILALAAVKLGYRPVAAIDLDPVAIRVAKANARRNRCSRFVRFSRRDLARLPLRSGRRFDVVCANLETDLLLRQRDRIVNRLEPGGALVLAGIPESQFSTVHRCYKAARLNLVASSAKCGWHSAVFRIGN